MAENTPETHASNTGFNPLRTKQNILEIRDELQKLVPKIPDQTVREKLQEGLTKLSYFAHSIQ